GTHRHSMDSREELSSNPGPANRCRKTPAKFVSAAVWLLLPDNTPHISSHRRGNEFPRRQREAHRHSSRRTAVDDKPASAGENKGSIGQRTEPAETREEH